MDKKENKELKVSKIDKEDEKELNILPTLVDSFFDLQKQNNDLRGQELANEKEETRMNHDYAMKVVDLQASDVRDKRKYEYKNTITYITSIFLGFTIISGILLYLVHIGEKELAKDILTHLGTAIITGVGSYFAGLNKGKSKKSDDELNIEYE